MVTDKPKRDHSQQQALFWPILLIGIGLIWLLNNIGILSTANLAALFRLWPLFLIFIGLDMLIGRDSPHLRPLLAVGAVVLLIVLAIVGPSLGLSGDSAVETHQFDIPIGAAQAANININTASAPVQFTALSDSTNLAEMQIVDSGQIVLEQAEGSTTSVSLGKQSGFDFGFFFEPDSEDRLWDIALSDRVPLRLELDLASGHSQLDLSGLQLTSLVIEGGSGNVELKLPGETYTIESDHGSGSWVVDVAGDAAFTWMIEDHGSGDLTVNVPSNVGIRLEIQDDSSGDILTPSNWAQISGDDEEGTWESGNYANADIRASIVVEDRGSGNITINQ